MVTDHRVGPLKKGDLKYRYPGLAGTDDPLQKAEPDASELNRQEWYEMLYFINKFANINGKGSGGVAKHAEKLIHENVPSGLRSHEKIRQWLLDHWKFYS
ncbi:MAG: hypothetical protein JWQ21_4108 [Herminiimonas sp.]|nr:hypothetical protein [Herminiimonas sp.]